MFIDEVKVKFIAWKWWDGIVSWRREKYIPKWWPYGGNWGKWGDIILQADANLNTLSEFRHKKVIRSAIWISWDTQEMTGAGGRDLIINVPVWTLVRDPETQRIIYDLKENWDQYLMCRWGKWGFWNSHFVSSTRQAPDFAELWDVWEEKEVILELKLVADIWIIWLPNAGKSTLIKTITNVKPKIADYPFTTIIPNLWVMEWKWKNLVLEDVPGLIKWASDWKWLGHTFLKHIERTTVILHLLDLQELDKIVQNYKDIRWELKSFSKELAKKEEIVVFSKADLFDKEMIDYIKKEFKKITKVKKIFVISAPMSLWIEELKDFLIDNYAVDTPKEKVEIKKDLKIYDLKEVSERFKIIDKWDLEFEVLWERIEQIVRMTNMTNYEATMRVYDVLDKMWILRKVNSIIRTKYALEMENYLFVNDKKEVELMPKIIIAGRVFLLDKIFLGNNN
ncbi:MAG: GTPase ObgE [uncultured bacterium (gcode 4)]|uniref:GTPase ObgE n=1 Tax=uncultured bacterium (gcode 4) TaxID=1234023 RepID=K2AE06_9BACT|nr:MAG: GTPase ObgE [uncultured bacterium (gcode 4)]